MQTISRKSLIHCSHSTTSSLRSSSIDIIEGSHLSFIGLSKNIYSNEFTKNITNLMEAVKNISTPLTWWHHFTSWQVPFIYYKRCL